MGGMAEVGGLGEVGKLGQARKQVRGMKVKRVKWAYTMAEMGDEGKMCKMGIYHGGHGGRGYNAYHGGSG